MPKPSGNIESSRRALLVWALANGLFTAGGCFPAARNAGAQVLGRGPKPLPPGQSFYDISGEVRVNGQPAKGDTRVGPNDVVETGKRAQTIFVVGSDAFLLREDSRLQMKGSNTLVNLLRLVTGAMLSVYGGGARTVASPNAIVGIRGTGLYVEAEPDLTYVCTCYGETDIATSDDPGISERIVSVHHDAPRYVTAKPDKGRRIIPAPFKNHTDLELTLIESLVGRVPPFSLFDESYGSPRRY